MNNVEVYIVAEGKTEQTFVRDVLAPEIAERGIYLHAAQIGKPGHKGGDIRFDRAKGDIGTFLKQRQDTFVSTMFDYYRIESAWPGREDVQAMLDGGAKPTTMQKAEKLEDATKKEIGELFPGYDAEQRFIPYIEMHEFEALLFSGPAELAREIGVGLKSIGKILEQFSTPEDINDDPQTAPSKRILLLNNQYRKVAMGKIISEKIGIPAIRQKCPHFDAWLKKLEQLSPLV